MSATVPSAAASRPSGLLYAVDDTPPPARLALLGLQYAVMAGIYLILVAIILRSAGIAPAARVPVMAVSCIALAVGALLQALPRGPIGSGFLAPPIFSATYLAPSVLAAKLGGMHLVFGMTVFAGLVEIAIGLALLRIRAIVTPLLSGLAIFIVGLQLGLVGIGQTLDVRHLALPQFPAHLAVALLTLAVAVSLSIWGRGVARLLCTMLGLAIGMAAAEVAGIVSSRELVALGHAGWAALPLSGLRGLAFDIGLAPAFFAAALAAALRVVGVLTTCQRMNDAGWRRPNMGNIRKGVLADGLANVAGGLLGAPGMSVAPSLVGISGVTGATSRAIAFVMALILFVVGLSPKLAAIFLIVPPEVAGPLLVFTACFMIAGGMGVMLANAADTRTNYIIGISTLLALAENMYPSYFDDLSPAVRSVTASPLALGLIAALGLTLLFRIGNRRALSIRWTIDDPAAAVAALRDLPAEWRLAGETVEAMTRDVGEVLGFIDRSGGARDAGTLRVVHEGGQVQVRIRYAGEMPEGTGRAAAPATAIGQAFDNEEAAAYVGLRDCIQSLAAERKEVRRRGRTVTVRLFYDG